MQQPQRVAQLMRHSLPDELHTGDRSRHRAAGVRCRRTRSWAPRHPCSRTVWLSSGDTASQMNCTQVIGAGTEEQVLGADEYIAECKAIMQQPQCMAQVVRHSLPR
jgi:hypothetical protein